MSKINLLDYSLAELEALLGDMGEKPFRARQMWSWIWADGCSDFASMTNISKALRERLSQDFTLERPTIQNTIISQDQTVKLLVRLNDQALIETVLIPEEDHYTQCLSVQVGCALACRFCATGRMGLVRNLTQAEMLGQIVLAREWLSGHCPDMLLRNVVLMGMGEPLMNVDNVIRALEVMNHPLALSFSNRRITLSTAGLPEGLKKLGQTGLSSLAISLHAPDQELRKRLMPGAAARANLSELMAALKAYPLRSRQRITFEYLLLKDVNDQPAQARQLVRLLSNLKCKVNLIAYNPGPEPTAGPDGRPLASPSPERILEFQKILWDKGIICVLRKSKGADIAAACGQLAARDQQNHKLA